MNGDNDGKKLRAAIVGGSGYTGGELLRIALEHPLIKLEAVTSRGQKRRSVTKAHPNLRGATDLRFVEPGELVQRGEEKKFDLIFLATPHGKSMELVEEFIPLTEVLVDLSGDFRLRGAEEYEQWYGKRHTRPDLLDKFVYGMPELYRSQLREARLIASPGCTATSAIIPLKPLAESFGEDIVDVVVDAKVGSSAGGASPNAGSHHPERRDVVRSYAPCGHRHTAEMEQELGISVSFSPHAVEMVRGILATIHLSLDREYEEKEIWSIYRDSYGEEPFVRFVKERKGLYRYPEPKLLRGTNFFEIGFEKDQRTGRLVIMAALDNLVKGAAGQAVQAANLAFGLEEKTGLGRVGLHPA